MAKIYLASSWRNDLQPAVIQLLRRYGHHCYDFRNPSPTAKGFSWFDIDPNWRHWNPEQYIKALTHPITEKGFALDLAGMEWADTCVLLLPSGRSAHTEAGWMKGQGKTVYVVTQDGEEPELMYKIFDGIFGCVADLVLHLNKPCPTCNGTGEIEKTDKNLVCPDCVGSGNKKEVQNG
jgi:hypothetical protein